MNANRYRPQSLALLVACLVLSTPVRAQFNPGEEYTLVDYAGDPLRNPIAELDARLRSGETVLEYREERGYLDSLLAALDINPSSQMLVFSPTSLQHKLISPQAPRAVFFNDNTYIGFVQNSTIVEVTAIDEEKGIVFYTFDNAPRESRYFERATQTCLVCHDTQGTMGGGVPMLMALSSVYSTDNVPLEKYSGTGNITDESPVADRWGGWYVTGRHGLQAHLGNILLDDPAKLEELDDYRIWNLETMDGTGYMDPSPYPRPTSDIVALMVLEHQLTIQNQITYIKFKAPAVMMRRQLEADIGAGSWAELSVPAQRTLTRMLDRLVARLVFMDAAPITSRLSGSQEFADSFQARGPNDPQGRTLRELKLNGTLFRYPLSYLVYSDDFDTLPGYARDYVYQKLAAWLEGREELEGSSAFSAADRQAALEILVATKPDFRPYTAAGKLAGTDTLAPAWR